MQRVKRVRRPASYRRRGPARRPLLVRWIYDARHHRRRALRRRRLQRRLHVASIVYAPIAIALTLLRKRAGLPPALAITIASGAPLAVAAALPPRSRWRYAAAGMTYMWLFEVSWELPADDPWKHRRRLRLDYPSRIDSALAGGVPPSQRLQRALRERGRCRCWTCDHGVYSSWFLPHLLLGYALLRTAIRPRAAGRLARPTTSRRPSTGLPTRPWYASEISQRMDGDVHRVARRVVCKVLNRPMPSEDEDIPGNPWGSMPSDHISSAAITAMALSEISVAHGAFGWLYVGGAAFAVIYLGEHYLVDVLAGLAIAELIRIGEPLAAPVVRAVAYALE